MTAKTAKTPKAEAEYLIVVTASRPWTIVAGYVESDDGTTVILRDARMIVYYSSDSRGLYGIASVGVTGSARVSPAAPRVAVSNVEHRISVTDEARASIEAAPWG